MSPTYVTKQHQDELDEPFESLAPLAGFIPGAGPPLFILAVPGVFFLLMLAGPFAAMVTLLVVLAVLVAVVAGAVALVVAVPVLLVRFLRSRRLPRPSAPVVHALPVIRRDPVA